MTSYYVDIYQSGTPRTIRGPYNSIEAARSAAVERDMVCVKMRPYDSVAEELTGYDGVQEVSLGESWVREGSEDYLQIYLAKS